MRGILRFRLGGLLITLLLAHSGLIVLFMVSSFSLNLITGGNVFVGFAVLAGALKVGVRIEYPCSGLLLLNTHFQDMNVHLANVSTTLVPRPCSSSSLRCRQRNLKGS